MDRIRVSVSREDGKPICPTEPETIPYFLTDTSPVLIVKKDGGTVETFSGGIFELLEFTVRQLKGLGMKERNEICALFGLEFHSSEKNE